MKFSSKIERCGLSPMRKYAPYADAAKARGVRFGRPRKRRPGIYKSTRESYLAGHITRSEAASRLKVSISTFDKWLREDRVKDPSSGDAVKRGNRR